MSAEVQALQNRFPVPEGFQQSRGYGTQNRTR